MNMIWVMTIFYVVAFCGVVILFGMVIRLISIPFSKRIRNQIKSHPILHLLWLYLAALAIGVFSPSRVNRDFVPLAFDAPLIQRDNLFANHTYGNDLICLDMFSHFRWRTILSKHIIKIWSGKTNEIIAAHSEGISSVNRSDGHIILSRNIGGSVFGAIFGVNENGYMYYQVNGNEIICKSYEEDKDIWRFKLDMLGSYHMNPSLFEDFVFLCINQSTISVIKNAPYKERFSTNGLNKLVCISASGGGQIWEETLPFTKAGFGSQIHLSSGPQYNLCVTENALRLIEKNSGKVVKRWESQEEDIDGADFWTQDRVVVCLGGVGSRERTIRVLNITDFSVYSEFRINALEVASVKVIADTLILESVYRNSGVDLSVGKKIWETDQWHYTVKEGKIFFGQHDDHYGISFRILGICDPTTGIRKVLYSEMAAMAGIKRQIYMIHLMWPLVFPVTIVFMLGIIFIGLLRFILSKRLRTSFDKRQSGEQNDEKIQ